MEQIFATPKSYAAVTAFYALALPEYHMEPHSHQSCEIMYVTGGNCTVFCGSEELSLRQNQFVFIDSAVPHRLEVSGEKPCSILNLEFLIQAKKTPLPLSELWEKSREFQEFFAAPPPFLVAEDLRSMGYAMKDLLAHLQKDPEGQDFLLCVLLYRMLLELSYCACQKRQASGLEYLKRARDYIDLHFLEEISIPDIAARAGINKSYLQALFSRMYHCTINTYINQKRLNQAAFLLTNSSLHITDVAFASGYNSRQHFAHTFEKFYGVSPSRYRRLHSRHLVTDTGESRYHIEEGEAKLEQMI